MKNVLLFLVAVMCAHLCTAQETLWTQDVAKGSYFKQLEDGNIFLKSGNSISLLDHKTGEALWQQQVATDNDPRFFDGLPIMYFEGKSFAVMDALDGKVIAKSDAKTDITGIHYFWDEGKIIVEYVSEKQLQVLSLDIADLDKSWTTSVGKAEKALFGLVNKGLGKKPLLTADGELVIADEKFIAILDSEGTVVKKIDFKDKIKVIDNNYAQSMVYLTEKGKTLHFLDVGKRAIAHSEETKDKVKQVAIINGGASIAFHKKKDLFIYDAVTGDKTAAVTYDEGIKTTYFDTKTGKFLVLGKKRLLEVDQKDGSTLLEVKFDRDFNYIFEVEDQLLIRTHVAFTPLDRETLQPTFAKPARLTLVHSYVDVNDEIGIYGQRTAEAYTLQAINKKSGEALWEKSYQGSATPSIDVFDSGVLIISNATANFLNIKNGKSMWKDPVKVEPSFKLVIDDTNERLIMHSEKRLFFFDIKSGALAASTDRFKFKDFDYNTMQPQIVPKGDNIFLKGSRTIYVTDKYGTIEHSKDYKQASTGSTLLKLANAAVTLGAIGTGNADKVVSVYDGNGNQLHQGSMVEGLNDQYAYADQMRVERQAKQNKSSNAYPYVYTKISDGKRGLIFLDPTNGDELYEVSLKEKDPNYFVDDVDGVLFYESEGKLSAIDIK